MSGRTDRIEGLLREEISAVLTREVQDPRIGFITVTAVDVSPDLARATVWVSLIGPEQERREALRGLSRAMPFVRRRLGVLRLKRIPELSVKHDETVERGTRVLQIISDLEQGREPEADGDGETLPKPNAARGDEGGAT